MGRLLELSPQAFAERALGGALRRGWLCWHPETRALRRSATFPPDVVQLGVHQLHDVPDAADASELVFGEFDPLGFLEADREIDCVDAVQAEVVLHQSVRQDRRTLELEGFHENVGQAIENLVLGLILRHGTYPGTPSTESA